MDNMGTSNEKSLNKVKSWSLLDVTAFPIIKKIVRNMHLYTRTLKEEVVYKYLLKLDDNRIIECMVIEHYCDKNLNDITFEISNMYSCPIGCTFCASGSLPYTVKHLSKEDFLGQIYTCLCDRNYDLDSICNVYVSFAGVGEPSLVYYEVSEGMSLIENIIPSVRFNIATTGVNIDCFEYWNVHNHSIRTLQIPCFAITEESRSILFKNIPPNYDLLDVINQALLYKKHHIECRIKLNYIVIRGINDSNEYVTSLINMFANYKNSITIKVSYLNETIQSKNLGLESPNPQRIIGINNMLASAGFDCYLFGTCTNTNLGCGQLMQQITIYDK